MAKIKEQIDYGGRREKMDPSLERKLASPDSLYAQNPAMKKGAADVQRLVSQRFGKVADKLNPQPTVEKLINPVGVISGCCEIINVVELITEDTSCPDVNPTPVISMPGNTPTVDVTFNVVPKLPTGL